MKIIAFLAGLLLASSVHAAPNVFNQDIQACSGRPWIDITCNGADPTGVADSTSAIQTTINAAISNDWPVFFPAGTYKTSSPITVEYGGQAANGPQIISQAAFIDGRSIASGNVLAIQCSGGTPASPVICNHFGIKGWLTIMGSGAGYVVTIGKTDFSDQQNGVRIDHLVTTNAGTGGGIQANYLTDGDLWLSGSTQGGSASVAAVALEQVQTSKIGGWGSALGANAPGLLVEKGASVGNTFAGFAFDANNNTCISITAAAATRNAWVAPYLPCTTAVNAPTAANYNALIGPTFAGANQGPTSTGISVIGRGSLNRFAAPAVTSQTLFGSDDGTIFSSANATGAPIGFTAASLPLRLPSAAQVGVGWTIGLVSDANKAVVATPPADSQILSRGMALASLIVASAGSNSNYEFAVLKSDGSNFRVEYISDRAASLNNLKTGLPWNWYTPGGPGYQATAGDNQGVISSAQTTSGLAVTLPSTTGLPPGWTVGLVQDSGKLLTVQVNGTAGGQILRAFGAAVTSFVSMQEHQVITLQFDGANFRDLSPPPQIAVDIRQFGARCDGTTDDSGAFVKGIAALSAGGGGVLQVPPAGHSCVVANGITTSANGITLEGAGLMHWPGFNVTDPEQYAASGAAIKCTDTVNKCFSWLGVGNVVRNIQFVYNQPTPGGGSWTPTVYPYTLMFAPGNFSGIDQVSFNGATHCVDWEGGATGVGGIGAFMNNTFFNGCFIRGTLFHQIDNTISCHNLRYDNYWGQAFASVIAYIEAHRVDWDMEYLANMQCDHVEFFESWRAIQLTNASVTSGFGTLTFAAGGLQLDTISFNEVCQAIAPTDVTVRGSGRLTNVLAYGDTTTGCPLGTSAMFDFTSNFANWGLAHNQIGFVQTLAAIGPTSNLVVVDADVQKYSAFAGGANAFNVSSGGFLTLSGTAAPAIRPGTSAGAMVGCGLDLTCGRIQPLQAGAGGNGVNGEGYVLVEGSGDNVSTGDIAFMTPTGVRHGFLGRSNQFGTMLLQSDNGAVGINGCPSGGCVSGGSPTAPPYAGGIYLTSAGGGQVSVATIGSSLQVILSGLPTSTGCPAGFAAGAIYKDSASGNLKTC